jgi:hypothetical protein
MRKIALRFNRLTPLLLAAGLLTGADKTTFQSKPVAEYPHRQASEGVTIAVQPFITDDEAKEAFGKLNPWRYGVLPVLLVIQNDGKDTLRVDKMKLQYELPDNSRVDATPASDVRYARPVKTPQNLPNPLPIHIGGSKKNPLDEWEIEGRAFSAKVIPPGQSASGFVYFQTPESSAAALVSVSGLTNAATGKELYYFEIPLSGK